MKPVTTHGLTPLRLAKLLCIGDIEYRRDQEEDNSATAELLRVQLDSTLPIDSDVVEALPVIIGTLNRELLPLEGKCLRDVLLDENSTLDAIQTIKNHAKEQVTRKSGSSRAAITTIYYAAIASALLFHGKKITALPYRGLAESFAMLSKKNWMAAELVRYFSKAQKFCKKKAK